MQPGEWRHLTDEEIVVLKITFESLRWFVFRKLSLHDIALIYEDMELKPLLTAAMGQNWCSHGYRWLFKGRNYWLHR